MKTYSWLKREAKIMGRAPGHITPVIQDLCKYIDELLKRIEELEKK